MAFKVYSGKVKNVWLPVTASTVLSARSLVTFTSGKLVAATAGTANTNIGGVVVKAITATDDDYADERLVAVQVPLEKHVVWEADVTSGLVAADRGLEVDATSATHLNRGASTVDVAKVLEVVSGTKGRVYLKLNGSY